MQTYVKNGNDILKMKQMYLAYKSIFNPPKQINWRTAIEIETNIINLGA